MTPQATCTKCGAALPHVTDAEFRCAYCGAVYRPAARPAADLVERVVKAPHLEPLEKKGIGPLGCAAAALVGLLFAGLAGFLALRVFVPDLGSRDELRMCGSSTISAELAPALVEEFLKAKSATGLQRKLEGKKLSVTALVPGAAAPVTITIDGLGTSTAFTGLANGTCDIAMASRAIDGNERASLPTASEHVIGLDGIAVIVHPASSIESLDTDQLSARLSRRRSLLGGRGRQERAHHRLRAGREQRHLGRVPRADPAERRAR